MLAQDELLARLAATFRRDVGPQVTDPFAKTQAFMAAVVLEKLSAQYVLPQKNDDDDYYIVKTLKKTINDDNYVPP